MKKLSLRSLRPKIQEILKKISAFSVTTFIISLFYNTKILAIGEIELDLPDIGETFIGDIVSFIFTAIAWIAGILAVVAAIFLVIAFNNKDADAKMQAGIGLAVTAAVAGIATAAAILFG
jgi:hypothetical protein